MNLSKLPEHDLSPKIVNTIIEIPKGTGAKYEYDEEVGFFRYDRRLNTAMVYPANYGFIPNTMGDDGDPIDVLLYNSIPIDRGTLVEMKVLGVLDMEDDGKKDYKIIGTPRDTLMGYDNLGDINDLFLRITANFFTHYKDILNKRCDVEVLGWDCKEKAYEILNNSYC